MLINKGKNSDHFMNVNIDGYTIKSTPDLKLLGVTLDDKLKFSKHVSDMCKQASKKVSVLVRLRKMIPTEAKLQLYKAAILPNLTYCHTVWHFCKASDTIKLERVQERALRAVYNSKMADYDELLSKAKLPSLVNRCLQDILILMYKVKNLLAPKHICDIFYKQFKNYDLRSSDFPIPRFNTVNYGKHSIRYLGPYIWGKVGKDLRNKTSLCEFKKAVWAINLTDVLDGRCSCYACST